MSSRSGAPGFRFGEDQGNALRGGNTKKNTTQNFTFRPQNNQSVPRFNQQLGPQQPARRPQGSNTRNVGGRGGYGGNSHRGGRYGGQRAPRPRPQPADRPLLSSKREPTPEQMEGMNEGGAKYKAVEDLSDSEASMDLETSDDENSSVSNTRALNKTNENSGASPPPAKKVKNNNTVTQPKWSNPDPYSVLPPTLDVSKVKKKDIVQTIRKARAEGSASTALKAQTDDFIKFDFGEPEEDSDSDSDSDDSIVLISETSKQPVKFSHLDNLHPNRIKKAAPPLPLEPAPVITIDNSDEDTSSAASAGPSRAATANQVTNVSVWPPPTIEQALPARVAQLKKKRKREDEYDRDQSIVPEWRAKPGKDPCPWYSEDTANTLDIGHRLHKEICDYYDYVRPRVFENDVRADLVRRMQVFLDQRYKDRTVKAFGSFEAGLCLPDSDMDLVVLSKGFMEGGPGIRATPRVLQNFARDLKSARMVRANKPVVVIAHAKVPIVKFFDDKTGLRVDIAFENDTGVTANQTYRDWHAEFPLMAPLVSLVKQWLYMRGQNDNATGGLGGFSTTCTVVSLLQQVRRYHPDHYPHSGDLGELFLHYLEYYGKFDTERKAIRLKDPPEVFNKARTRYYNPQNPYRLCIVDPNRPDNDISGGSRNAHIILESMYDAYEILRARMHAIVDSEDHLFRRQSLLAPLFAGDYSSFENTREHLRNVAKTMSGIVADLHAGQRVPPNHHGEQRAKLAMDHAVHCFYKDLEEAGLN